jgi:hypothetical protein
MANINSIGNNPYATELERVLLTEEGFNLDKDHEKLRSATFWGRPGGINPFGMGTELDRCVGLTLEDRRTLRDAQYVIFSYRTPVAWKMADGRWMAPRHTYSPTTRQHILTAVAGLSCIDVREENGNLVRP